MKLYNKHGFYIVWIRFWCILWFDCSLFVLSFCERFHLMRCQYQYTFLLIMLRHFTDFYDFWGTKNKTEKSTERRRQRHKERKWESFTSKYLLPFDFHIYLECFFAKSLFQLKHRRQFRLSLECLFIFWFFHFRTLESVRVWVLVWV